jgi:metallo-beta-lactamase family protein
MAAQALQFYAQRVDELDEDLRGQGRALTAFMTRRFEVVPSTAQSVDLVRSDRPAIIVSSSGMATGGRVLNHLERVLPDPRHTVLFVGYQAAGTRGRALVDGVTQIKMHGRIVGVAARIELIESMSAHADQGEILRWLKGFERPPAMTYVVHGEPGPQDALQEKIRAMPGWKTLAPEYAQGVDV